MPSARAPPATAAQPKLPDELLEDIFVRLDDAADLVRASAACTSFRRVVSERGFLRRFRSLHRPPVLGFIDSSHGGIEFHESQPPHRSAPAARAVAQSADFTFSFLADPKGWRACDARDGRILLVRNSCARRDVFDAFVVYDPLHHRHVQIPPIPSDLVTSTVNCGDKHCGILGVGPPSRCVEQHFEAFLAPACEDAENSTLQVICNVVSRCKIAAFIYSSVTGKWQCITTFRTEAFEWMRFPILFRRSCARNCFFWTEYSEQVMLVLHTHEMKFSIIDLPSESYGRIKTIAEANNSRLGLCIVYGHILDIYTTAWQDSGVGRKDWRHDNQISLPVDKSWLISDYAATNDYILLRGTSRDGFHGWKYPEKKPDAHYVTVNVKTLSVEQLCVLKFETSGDYLYASFPPPLSLPRI